MYSWNLKITKWFTNCEKRSTLTCVSVDGDNFTNCDWYSESFSETFSRVSAKCVEAHGSYNKHMRCRSSTLSAKPGWVTFGSGVRQLLIHRENICSEARSRSHVGFLENWWVQFEKKSGAASIWNLMLAPSQPRRFLVERSVLVSWISTRRRRAWPPHPVLLPEEWS